jgi:predicted permease
MNGLWQDLRYALRMMARNPGFTAIAVLTLALGIGANSVIFCILNALLLRSLPVPEPERVVRISASGSYLDYVDFRDQARSFEGLAADYEIPVVANLSSGHPPDRVFGVLVTGNFFSLLGVKPVLGRGFAPDEDQVSSPKPVVILSYGLWRRRFNGDPEIVGKAVRLNGGSYSVIGVAPQEFHGVFFGLLPDFWAPMAVLPQIDPFEAKQRPFTNRDEGGLDVIGRIKPGVTRREALAEVNLIHNRIRMAAGKKDTQPVSLENPATLPGDVSGFALGLTAVLMTVSALVLLVACANLANLLLARAMGRRKEIAIRMAIGVSRGRLIRHLLTGNLLLSFLGAAAAFLLSAYAAVPISHLEMPVPFPFALDFTPDLRVLAATTGVAVLTTFLFGLAPALQATRSDVSSVLKDGESTSGGMRGRKSRNALVIAQVAISVVVLAAASLFLHSLRNEFSTDLGFRPDQMLVLRVDPKLQGYSDDKCLLFFRQLQQQVSTLPGVRAASFVAPLPLSLVSSGRDFTVPGTSKTINARMHVVGADYFKTMGIPLLRGRDFSYGARASSADAVISNSMAKELFGNEDPVGRTIHYEFRDDKRTYQIVGTVADAKSETIREEPEPTLYEFVDQNPEELGALFFFGGMSLVVKTAGSPAELITPVKQAVERLDPDLPVYGIETMEEQVGKYLLVGKLVATLLTVFGAVALILAAVGLYGVMSYSVACRTREIAIRMAVGASSQATLRMIAREALFPVVVGLGIGFALAAVAGRFVSSFLYGVGGGDPVTFVAVPLVLLSVACAAIIVPARRAAKVDPMVALRYE